jgi:predicted amidohydrolase
MICADRWLRGVEEIPIQEGAQISFEVASNLAVEWVPAYQWYWYVPRAMRNSAWVVFSNSANAPGTPPGQGRRHGHGAIIDPNGRLVAASPDDTEEMTIAEIDVSAATRAAAEARASHPVLKAFWEAGVKLQRGEKVDAPLLVPLRSPQVEVTLAAAQVAGDLAAMKRAVAEAHGKGADVVAFPAQSAKETDLPALQTAARESGITVVFGAMHRAGAETFNSAFVIGPDGTLLTRYDQLSAPAPFATGINPAAMWFTVKGVPAIVTLERDALWTEIAELAAVEGARVIIHLDHDTATSDPARLQRMQIWANHASFLTFTATVNDVDSTIWDDLRGMEEISAEYKGRPRINSGPVEVFSPWSANLVVHATPTSPLIVATRKIPSPTNPHHPNQTSRYNPQMEPWYRIGAKLIHPQ